MNHNQLFDGYGMGLLLTRPFTGYSPSLHVIRKVHNKKAKVQTLQVDLTDILLLYIGLMKFCKKGNFHLTDLMMISWLFVLMKKLEVEVDRSNTIPPFCDNQQFKSVQTLPFNSKQSYIYCN